MSQVPTFEFLQECQGTADALVFTVGHSNHPFEKFASLLTANGVDVVVDTRSYPASKYAPQFNRYDLKSHLAESGMRYWFLGDKLGGRPREPHYYDEDGYVIYSDVAKAAYFTDGLDQLIEKAIANGKYAVALMCSEENPGDCHRRLLVGRVLAQRNIAMVHIRGSGALEREHEFVPGIVATVQPDLFSEQKEPVWRSVRSVLRREAQPDFSAH